MIVLVIGKMLFRYCLFLDCQLDEALYILVCLLLLHFLSFVCYGPISDIRNWMRNIEQHASDNVNKILIGNKADMDPSKRVGFLFLVQFLFDNLILISFLISFI